jgi:CheY-specific phosphatase CheX
MTTTQLAEHGQLPAEHVDCVRDSVLTTFSGMWEIDPCDAPAAPGDGIVGIISLVGDIAWSVAMSFPKQTAIDLTLKFAGFEIDYDSDDMGDVVGELVNVLAGDLIARLDQMGITANLSLPTVARGSRVQMLMPGGQVSSEMFFRTPEGVFELTVAAGKVP